MCRTEWLIKKSQSRKVEKENTVVANYRILYFQGHDGGRMGEVFSYHEDYFLYCHTPPHIF